MQFCYEFIHSVCLIPNLSENESFVWTVDHLWPIQGGLTEILGTYFESHGLETFRSVRL